MIVGTAITEYPVIIMQAAINFPIQVAGVV
jgi:hypothetical protein